MHFWLVADEASELLPQHARERVAERREQHARLRVRAREVDGAMQRDHRLAGAGRAGDARRASILAIHELLLRGVQEHRPLLPRVVEGSLQRVRVLHDAEAALRVGMGERVGLLVGVNWYARGAARRQLKQCFGGLRREVLGELEERVIGRRAHVGEPFERDAVCEQVLVQGGRE